MAITGSVALSSATIAHPPGTVGAVLTVSNSGGTAVNVVGIEPVVQNHGGLLRTMPGNLGACGVGPGVTVSVAAAGSTTFPFSVALYGPKATGSGSLCSPSTFVYDVGANIICQDGSRVAATVATCTVSADLT